MHAKGRFTPKNRETAIRAQAEARAHTGVTLSDVEFYALANWIDANCQFHPSYWGRKHAKYASHENFRPSPTFEEATGTVRPEWNN